MQENKANISISVTSSSVVCVLVIFFKISKFSNMNNFRIAETFYVIVRTMLYQD